jgi:HAD superfamily hydrolase (TIGR01484 family)
MKFKAIITDLDGTAINSPAQKNATDRLRNAVLTLESKGIKVCAATGRAQTFADPVIKSMGLRQPVIVSGGARIIEPSTNKELWALGLSADQAQDIVSVLKETNYGCLWNDSSEQDYLEGGWPIKQFHDYESSYFFEVCFIPHKYVTGLVERLKSIPGLAVTVVVAQRPDTNDIHITNEKATKEHAIYELEKLIDVPKDEMIGAGDGHNDIHLFNAVGYKVAVGNAVPELKAVADKVISGVREDGLAIYFETLIEELSDEV